MTQCDEESQSLYHCRPSSTVTQHRTEARGRNTEPETGEVLLTALPQVWYPS